MGTRRNENGWDILLGWVWRMFGLDFAYGICTWGTVGIDMCYQCPFGRRARTMNASARQQAGYTHSGRAGSELPSPMPTFFAQEPVYSSLPFPLLPRPYFSSSLLLFIDFFFYLRQSTPPPPKPHQTQIPLPPSFPPL